MMKSRSHISPFKSKPGLKTCQQYTSTNKLLQIQPKTIDITMGLQEIITTTSVVYSLEPCAKVYCFRIGLFQ